MFNAAHVLETALLILAAFLVGATIGTVARLLVRRPATKSAVTLAAPPVVEAKPEQAPALVVAPIIEPLPNPAKPAVPSEIPTPDFAAIIKPVVSAGPAAVKPAPKVMSPARVAGQTTSGILMAPPLRAVPTAAAVVTSGESAEVIPFPVERTSAVEPTSTVDEADLVIKAAPAEIEDAAVEASADAALAAAPESADVVPVEPQAVVEPVTDETEATAPDQDEGAAMRAIEGNWSPLRRSSKRRVRAAAVPTPSAAEPEPQASGRPAGLESPRLGVSDELTHIIGVVPIIETALNRAGIYHFDQLAAFTDENVAWLEGHLGIAGRIDREHWREQARELAVLAKAAAAKSAEKA